LQPSLSTPRRIDVTQQNLPNPASDDATRFEAAPDADGTLIPIPSEAPKGSPIRDDAKIIVSARQPNGYYVEIYNGPPDPPSEVNDRIEEVLTEAGMKAIERTLLAGDPAVLEFALGAAGVLASVLTTSPLLKENFYQGTMSDGTQVTYAVLTPRN
jgi:hypothetical protein